MIRPASEALAQPPPAIRRRGFLGLMADGLRDLVTHRRLIRYLVGAELKRTHADTVLGQAWWILDPLLQMAVYYVLVEVIFHRNVPDYPLFLFSAILPWKWFSTTINEATLSVTGRQSLIRQLSFPKIVLPTAAVAAETMSFVFGLGAFALVYLFYLDRLSAWVLVLPVIAAIQVVFTLALAIAFSAANAFYRDIQNVLRHALRIWFYLSPALYSLDLITNRRFREILQLNPFAVLFESYHAVTWGTSAPDWSGLAAVLAVSLVLLLAAILLFKRVEPAFARIL
jgi:lipopolysaccharide transport system permease protein/teichoic acid transport system permease protein